MAHANLSAGWKAYSFSIQFIAPLVSFSIRQAWSYGVFNKKMFRFEGIKKMKKMKRFVALFKVGRACLPAAAICAVAFTLFFSYTAQAQEITPVNMEKLH